MTSHKKNILFIINPKSGIGKQNKIEGLIENYFAVDDYNIEIVYSQAKYHATALSADAAKKAYDAVVAVGGDGTINEVAQGIINTTTALGIIPAGSGNGLAHHLKIPLRTSKAIKLIKNFNTKWIDTGTVNNKIFISIAGVGFDAHVAKKFSKSKKRGFWSYTKIAFLEYIKYNNKSFKITVNNRDLKTRKFMICFANSNQFGFNARISPKAKIDDGYLDLCLVRKPRIYYVIFLIPFFFFGLLDKTPFVRIIKTKEVKVIQLKNNISHIDGDEIDLGKKIEVKIVPASLKIIC